MLGPVSLADCVVFVVFLAAHLVLDAGVLATAATAARALPFVLVALPLQLARTHLVARDAPLASAPSPARTPSSSSPPPPPPPPPPPTPKVSLFQDAVLRCTKWAFVHVPPRVGRVFFSPRVVRPFLWFRLLRHGRRSLPAHVSEVDVEAEPSEKEDGASLSFKGLWIRTDPDAAPDVVVYYIHGGGFALGSPHFYLEFLLSWHALLIAAGYRTPAIFALDYTLVPDARFPAQLDEAVAAYAHVLAVAGNPRRVCLAGDSAGGTLVLSLLLDLAARRGALGATAAPTTNAASTTSPTTTPTAIPTRPQLLLPKPHLAILVSPWPSLVVDLHQDHDGDFLDKHTLWRYARDYAGDAHLARWPANPSACCDDAVWRRAAPRCGFVVVSGEHEVLAADMRDFVARQRRRGIAIEAVEMAGRPHVWPVVALYLGSTADERLEGLRAMVDSVSKHIPVGEKE